MLSADSFSHGAREEKRIPHRPLRTALDYRCRRVHLDPGHDMISEHSIANDFPSLAGRAYLNTAAEGIPPREVGAALSDYWNDKQSGMDGRAAHFRREASCREIAGKLLNRPAGDIAFCSCSAEAYNLLATALDLGPEDEVVISDLDFPSGTTPWLARADRPRVRLWQSVDGSLEISHLLSLLGPRTRLVQASLVSFYNGFCLDWPQLVEAVRRGAPQSLLALDVTQALGRQVLDCRGADIVVSSTHKWALGIHGGCVVAVRGESADRLTTRAGGWYNLVNAFEENRFSQVESKRGAASYSVGMPGFASIYALEAGLRYVDQIGIERIAKHADALAGRLYEGMVELGFRPLAPFDAERCSGIIAFRDPVAGRLNEVLHSQGVHAMFHAGRIRFSVHGYNTARDISRALDALRSARDAVSGP